MTGTTGLTVPADRVLPFTRIVAAALVPFLAVASVLLFVFPTRTETLFAWTITPALTAMLLACAYIGGIWFFTGVARERRWHRVQQGFPAVVVFASLLCIATLVHFDKFHAGTFIFAVWLVLYLTTPFITSAVALVNRAQNTAADDGEYVIPTWLRTVLIVVGGGSLVTGLGLFVFADQVTDAWAWSLTPLTAQVIGAVLTLPGMVNITMLRERRWSAYRTLFQAQLVSLVFIAIALVVGRGDLLWQRPVTWMFVAGIAVSIAAFTFVYVSSERGAARAAPAPIE